MKPLPAERHLTRKSELLDQMTANNEKLRSFIPKRNMLGLKRALQEMDRLIEELSAINILLTSQVNGWQQPAGFRAAAKDLALQQTALVTAYRQTLQAAAAEQQQIAGELRELRAAQRLQTGYTGPWASCPGGRLSVKG